MPCVFHATPSGASAISSTAFVTAQETSSWLSSQGCMDPFSLVGRTFGSNVTPLFPFPLKNHLSIFSGIRHDSGTMPLIWGGIADVDMACFNKIDLKYKH